MNPSLQIPDEGMTLEELSNFVGMQMKRLNLVLKSIDGLNIVDIKFELQGGAYLQFNRKGLVFNDGTNNTFTVGIDGKVTLTGALVQSVAGAYPNVQLDGEGNIFQASKSATEYIAIDPDLAGGSPALKFQSPNVTALLSAVEALGIFWLNVTKGDLVLQSQSGTIYMYPDDFVIFESWSKIYNGSQTLQQALDAISSSIPSGDYAVVTYSSGVATSGRSLLASDMPSGIDASKIGSTSTVSNSEYATLDGVTSPLQPQLDTKAAAAQPSVTAPTLLNSWVNFSGGWESAGYYKETTGRVCFQGFISGGTITQDTIIFTLPVGYRPSNNRMLGTITEGGSTKACSLYVDSSGNVRIYKEVTSAWLSLENISFRP